MYTLPAFDVEDLQNRHDLASIRTALLGVCARFGRVRTLTIFPVNRVGQAQALCFLRMASAEEEQQIMTVLGIGRFGGEMVLVVNLRTAPELVASET